MTTYVLAHGEVRTEFGNVKTFGKRVRAYSEVDSYLLVSNGIATVSNGGNGQAAGTFEGDSEIPVGWHFTTVEDEIMQLFLSAVVDEGELKMVGDKLPGDLWMCMDPATCIAAGRHTCTGLLGQVDDDDIVIIACRGISGSTTTKADTKLSLGSEAPDGDFDEALTEKVNELVAMYNRDPDEFGAEWDQLPQGTIATLSAWPVIRQAADLSWKISEQKQGELTALVASDSAAAIAYYDALPPFQQARMGTYKELRDWAAERDRQVGAQEDFETGAAEAWVPTDQELSYIAQTNKDNVKATGDEESVGFIQAGFVTLIGDGHDAEYVDWVNSQPDYASGSITVYKGGAFSSGKFEVSGCPPAGQGVLEANVARFSDKDVEFV